MSNRLTANELLIARSKEVDVVLFAEFVFSTATYRTHTSRGTYEDWNAGAPWIGVGKFGGARELPESITTASRGVELFVSGINDVAGDLGPLRDPTERGALVNLYWGYVHPVTHQLVDPPQEPSQYRFDNAQLIFNQGAAELVVRCAGPFEVLNNATNASLSPEDQRLRFPGSTFLDFQHLLADRVAVWGGSSVINPGGVRVPGEPVESDFGRFIQLP